MNTQIIDISIDRLIHHPKNPRADLGDLTELAASIAARGVMQNLTVIPCPDAHDSYWVVIGNRRMEAAKLAGLDTLPCAVVEMDEREQISTMLLENIQRDDLSVIDQANGFQMMMDLGMSTSEIHEKTGFSETTIRSRVRLCQFDRDQFAKGCAAGATLMDWAEVAKLKDPAHIQKAIDNLGTANFRYTIKACLECEEKAAWVESIIPAIEKWATRLEGNQYSIPSGYRYLSFFPMSSGWDGEKNDQIKHPSTSEETEFFYMVTENQQIYIVIKAQEKTEEQTAAERAKKERIGQLMEVNKTAYNLRRDFVKGYQPRKGHMQLIAEYLIASAFMFSGYNYIHRDSILNLLGLVEDGQHSVNIAKETADMPIEKRLLVYVACGGAGTLMDGKGQSFSGYDGSYESNDKLRSYIDLLISIGYELSDTEKQLMDGTHPLYTAKDAPEDEEEDT